MQSIIWVVKGEVDPLFSSSNKKAHWGAQSCSSLPWQLYPGVHLLTEHLLMPPFELPSRIGLPVLLVAEAENHLVTICVICFHKCTVPNRGHSM